MMHINLTQMEDKELTEYVKENMEELARYQNIEVDNVFKTGTYRKPKEYNK